MKRGKPLTLSQSLTVIKAVDMDDDEMIGKDDLSSYCMSHTLLEFQTFNFLDLKWTTIIKRGVVFKGALI